MLLIAQTEIVKYVNQKLLLFRDENNSLTQLSRPRKNNIRKKIIAQNCGNGSIPIASGYVMKAKAGPPVATDDTGNPVTSAERKIAQIAFHYLIYFSFMLF